MSNLELFDFFQMKEEYSKAAYLAFLPTILMSEFREI